MISRKSLRLAACTLFVSCMFTGGLLVWISTAFHQISSTSPHIHSLTMVAVQPNLHLPLRLPGGLNIQRKGMLAGRRVAIQRLIHGEQPSRDEHPAAVRIFRRSGQVLFTPPFITRPTSKTALVTDRPAPRRATVHVQDRRASTAVSFETDVLVFLHIQKTGGTAFELHLLDIESTIPCICDGVQYVYTSDENKNPKHCDCQRNGAKREQWLFSRFTFSWVCGVHADWTQLVDCVPTIFETHYGLKPRTFFFFTILRQPVERFLSEYEHMARGANWDEHTYHQCKGSRQRVQRCLTVSQNMSQSLDNFLSCRWNLAINRQSRMLANMSGLSECYIETSQKVSVQEALLVSAKENLMNLAFFGLSEFQMHTQMLFERTFGVRFKHRFEQRPLDLLHSQKLNISMGLKGRIARINRLDMYLYMFAKKVFLQRIKELADA